MKTGLRWSVCLLAASFLFGPRATLSGQNASIQEPPVEIGPLTVSRGLNVVPVFEGWEQNADGSFNMVFAYLNRNYDEEIDIPIGPDNSIEPAGPDRGQPTHFYPRRNRFVFRVTVPKDW